MNATAKPQPSVNSVEGSALGFAGVPVFDAGPRANTAFSSTIVFAGTLRSGQDLPYAKSVAPILKNPALQLRLTSLDRMLFGFSGYGARVMARHNNVTLTSLFPEDPTGRAVFPLFPGKEPTARRRQPAAAVVQCPQFSVEDHALAGGHGRQALPDPGGRRLPVHLAQGATDSVPGRGHAFRPDGHPLHRAASAAPAGGALAVRKA